MCDRSGMTRHEPGAHRADDRDCQVARAPDLPSPTFAGALDMLCHCGEKLNKDCECNAANETQGCLTEH